jgi:hypothetical protein
MAPTYYIIRYGPAPGYLHPVVRRSTPYRPVGARVENRRRLRGKDEVDTI